MFMWSYLREEQEPQNFNSTVVPKPGPSTSGSCARYSGRKKLTGVPLLACVRSGHQLALERGLTATWSEATASGEESAGCWWGRSGLGVPGGCGAKSVTTSEQNRRMGRPTSRS